MKGPAMNLQIFKSRKLFLVLAIVLILLLGVTAVFANPPSHHPGHGPKCPNPGGHTPPACAIFNPPGPCNGAAIDTEKILGPNAPLRVCVFL
jgi:hypothetical protein